jgi:hypothetical protein
MPLKYKCDRKGNFELNFYCIYLLAAVQVDRYNWQIVAYARLEWHICRTQQLFENFLHMVETSGIPYVHKTISPADLGGTYSQIIVLSPQTADEPMGQIRQWCATHAIAYNGEQPETVFGDEFLHRFREHFSGKGQPVMWVGEWGG